MKKQLKYIISVLVLAILATGCYYDKEEELYNLNLSVCDTSNVTYVQTIAPIMQSYCNNCHSSTGASGGWVTENYNGLKIVANNGKLLGAVTHAPGFSPMPKGSGQLTNCQIAVIRKWLNDGSPNN